MRPQPRLNNVSPQNTMPLPDECDVRTGMAVHFERREVQAKFCNVKSVAMSHTMGRTTDAWFDWRVARHIEALQQLLGTADMVGMMVGEQDRNRAQACVNRLEHWSSFAWIHDHRATVVTRQRPDVVVGECLDGVQLQHEE
jgi:hypothetical protein